MSAPSLSPCRIYVHSPRRALAAQHVPKTWSHNQYAVEHWLQRALRAHPWRVRERARAELVFVAANFSLFCVAGKTYQRRLLWDELMAADDLAANRTPAGIPSFLPLQYGGCPEPWAGATPGRARRKRPKDMLLLLDMAIRKGADRRNHSVASPFVVAEGQLAPGGSLGGGAVSWGAKRLLFFAGHVPKLYLNRLRYRLWKQLRRDARVTAISSTLACTVGAYAACRLSDSELR